MKRIFAILLCLMMLIGCVACAEQNNDPVPTEEPPEGYLASDAITNYVRMSITYTAASGERKVGDVIVKLAPDIAPITVANFQKLVSENFYNGLTFHRVVKNFMIQGGDPKGDGTGDSGERIKGEFASNGISNSISHERGVISMARGNYSMDSASCQFFIMHADYTGLDGDYAAFGYVVYGMDTVDGIANTAVDNPSSQSPKPIETVLINFMRFVKPINETPDEPSEPETPDEPTPVEKVAQEGYTLSEETTNLVQMNITYTTAAGERVTGNIIVELDGETAPITVANFQKLVGEGFYDGLTFHRVVEDFMIQGGDPKGNGTGNSDETIKGEFSANGVENNISHVRGVISMARRFDSMDSASCQFFIMHADYTGLDGQYAAFGHVVYGMDTVDGIATTPVNNPNAMSPKPVNPVTINYMCFVTPNATEA